MKKVADYPEVLVPILLSSLFARLSGGQYYLIPLTQAQENIHGYDAELRGPSTFTPIYMQFKRPSAYTLESRRADIIVKRRKLGILDHDDVLFFKLHPKKDHHNDYQHNILYNLAQSTSCVAAYICPIFLKADQYQSAINRFAETRCRVWDIEPESQLINDNSWINADMSLVLNTHAAIKPHKTVMTAKHQYSFDVDCKNIVFHSPEKVEDNYVGLGDFLNSAMQKLNGKSDEKIQISPSTTLEKLLTLVGKMIPKEGGINPYEYVFADALDAEEESKDLPNDFKYWIRWGSYLEANYGIRQYGLFKRD